MERVTASSGLDVVRMANSRVGRFLERFSGAAVFGTDEEVEALLQIEGTLRSVGALLQRDLSQTQQRDVREELDRYRQNLIQLRLELACMQKSAEACRLHLETRQKHLHAAKAWCAASRALT